ncbi:MAG: hypothetical protein PHS59_03925 [Paludibacter sp.]|nr:hypothetical protein [Paludibacter sp.]
MNIVPWNYWIFRVELGSDFEGEESKQEYSLKSSFKTDWITETLKFKSTLSYDINNETYKDNNEIITSKKKEAELNTRLIYSLNPRWFVGLFGELSRSSYPNLNSAMYLGPAIEYNIFPLG